MEISNLIDNYSKWLNEEISFIQIGNFYEITTPFLDINNDYLQIYIKISKDTIYFTDDGYTLNTLLAHGLSMLGKRKELLNNIIHQYGIKLRGYELVTECSIKAFPQTKHFFIQCMLKINDLFMLKQKNKSKSTFIEEVSSYFDKNDIFPTENIQVMGETGFMHSYDFVFPKNRTTPERFCNAINTLDKPHISSTIFSWLDTKKNRKSDSTFILLVNDSDKSIKQEFITASINYNIKLVSWIERDIDDNLKNLVS